MATLSDALGPTATALLPTARRLPTTLRDSPTLFEGAALLPLRQIPPFVRAVLPLAGPLPPIQRNLSAVPPLISSFKVLDYATNELTYNPGDRNRASCTGWPGSPTTPTRSSPPAMPTAPSGAGSCSPRARRQEQPVGSLFETVLRTNFGC